MNLTIQKTRNIEFYQNFTCSDIKKYNENLTSPLKDASVLRLTNNSILCLFKEVQNKSKQIANYKNG